MAKKTKTSIKRHFKNWLIPHHGNRHHPKLVRPTGLAACLVLIILFQVIGNYGAAGKLRVLGYASNVNAGTVTSLTNQERNQRGLPALSSNAALRSAAAAKAHDMFAKDYWAHVSPSGTQPWYFINRAGYSYTYAGENLARDFDTSSGVVAGWMASSSHRANILNTHYKNIGVAVANGELNGEQTTLVVEMFGTPVAAASRASTPAPTAATPKPKAATKPTARAPLRKKAPVDEPEQTLAAESTPAIQTYGLLNPLLSLKTLRPGELATLWVLGLAVLVNVLRHTAIWRQRRGGLRHIWFRSHPLAQASLLFGAMLIVIISSFGVVG